MSPARPDFLVIGSQKAGTTTVHRALEAHPDAWVPPLKDLNVFSADGDPPDAAAAYQRHFADAPPGALIGETSPAYLVHPRAPARIRRALPDVKLVVLIREPIARAVSQYWDSRRWLVADRPFAEYARPPLSPVWRAGSPGYISRGCYAIYLERYRALFPPAQIKVLQFERMLREPAGFWGELFGFLGLAPIDVPAAAHNRRSLFDNPAYRAVFERPALNRWLPPGARRLLRRGPRVPFDRPPLDAATREALLRFYAPWNRRLEALLGVELGWPGPGD